MSELMPPEQFPLYWCNGCERIAFVHPMKHYWQGRVCKETVYKWTYRRADKPTAP